MGPNNECNLPSKSYHMFGVLVYPSTQKNNRPGAFLQVRSSQQRGLPFAKPCLLLPVFALQAESAEASHEMGANGVGSRD